jgi:hypothetical protein
MGAAEWRDRRKRLLGKPNQLRRGSPTYVKDPDRGADEDAFGDPSSDSAGLPIATAEPAAAASALDTGIQQATSVPRPAKRSQGPIRAMGISRLNSVAPALRAWRHVSYLAYFEPDWAGSVESFLLLCDASGLSDAPVLSVAPAAAGVVVSVSFLVGSTAAGPPAALPFPLASPLACANALDDRQSSATVVRPINVRFITFPLLWCVRKAL